MDDVKKFLTVPEAARFFGVDRCTMWRWVKAGQVRASTTLGGHYRIAAEDLDRAREENGARNEERAEATAIEPYRVLVVDDDPLVRKTMARALTEQGLEVDTAGDGFQAGLKVMSFQPHLMVLDLIMPRVDGFDVCRTLKENPDTREIRTLVVTGYGTEENRRRAEEAEADGFLVKPVDEEELIRRIFDLLGASMTAC
jgi:excisionase family DNA binding protein